MTKLITIISIGVSTLILTGCSTSKEAIKSMAGKNVNMDGYVMYNKITTGATSESPAPEIIQITGSLEYTSHVAAVPAGSKVPSSATYRRKSSASILNSKAVTTTYHSV